MTRRALALPLLLLSLSLTRCALTDHFELLADAGDSAGGRGDGTAGANVGGLSAKGDAGTAQGGDVTVAGSSGSGSLGGALSELGGAVGQAGAASCADTQSDAQNCGSCGNVCDKGRTCAAGACSAGWLTVAAPPTGFVGRTRAASVAIGKSVFVWGGLDNNGAALDSGAIYSPVTDDWVEVPTGLGMLTPRSMATAVWTGTVVIVFGGVDGMGNLLKDAAAYDPSSKIWSPLPAAATRRSQTLGFWDGTHVVFWGGTTANNVPIAGADRFDLTSWATSNSGGDPGALLAPAAAFDGAILYMQGGLSNGNTRQDKVFSYTTKTDNWSSLSKSVTARSSAFGVWDGTHFVVWGGRDDYALRNDGKYMSGSTWIPMGAIGAPSARLLFARRGGWAFPVRPGVVAILGGEISLIGAGSMSSNGATYDTAANAWKPIADWPTGEGHEYGSGVWTGDEFVVWSGQDAGKTTTTGQRLAF